MSTPPPQELWIFGYGSLIWRPNFPSSAQHDGYVRGWARRFYQGSRDHRGTEDAPGRVVTLIQDEKSNTHGRVYKVEDSSKAEVLRYLGHREKGGYTQHDVDVIVGGLDAPIKALVFIATETNEDYLGPAETNDIAQQIAVSVGPSGPNVEYLFRLAEALRSMGANDTHVFTLEDTVKRILQSGH